MAVGARWLADKSALARLHRDEVRRVLAPRIADGAVATCAIVDLEVLYSARSVAEYADLAERRRTNYVHVPVDAAVCARALQVQASLALRSQHRAAGIADLLIAACAELHGLVVVHYDADYEAIAVVTGQPVEWVVPGGVGAVMSPGYGRPNAR